MVIVKICLIDELVHPYTPIYSFIDENVMLYISNDNNEVYSPHSVVFDAGKEYLMIYEDFESLLYEPFLLIEGIVEIVHISKLNEDIASIVMDVFDVDVEEITPMIPLKFLGFK